MELIDDVARPSVWFYPVGRETEEEKVHPRFWSIPWVQEHRLNFTWTHVFEEIRAHLPIRMIGRSTPGEQEGYASKLPPA